MHGFDGLIGDLQRLVVAHGRRAVSGVTAQVEVGGHFSRQVSEVLHDGGMRLAIAEYPKTIEHLEAELVCGGNGGGVELRKRTRHPLASRRQLIWPTCREHDLEGAELPGGKAPSDRIGEAALDPDQSLPHSQPKFVGRHSPEGDQQ
jgi:hypothetical protein